GYQKKPYERVEHWMDNAITFPSVPRYQLMNCQWPGKEPMQLDDMEERRQLDKRRKPPKSGVKEKIVIVDIFAWTSADMTGILRDITEHNLYTFPHIEANAQKKRSLAPDTRKVVTDEVNEWLKADIIRRAYPKDLYPLPEIDWKIESLMGFQYKCLLDAYKGYHQIQMTKKDEEKTAFHTEEGVFCYTKMPFGLKNAWVTYQRLVDSSFKEQIRVNLEAYMTDMMIKSPLQANYVIREVHMGSCGMHDGPKQVVAKAMNLGYFWPSMHRDALELIRACDNFQAHVSVPRLPKAYMISVTSAYPFMKWGMDIVGPPPEGPRRVKYLIVATSYFTKWIEAKPLATITGKQLVNITLDNIVCEFGIPAIIITDNGTQFVNDPFKKWAEKLKIQLICTSFITPRGMKQWKGQTEAS
nr:reverse transcriptase domain-containing protein [Tanacetum cinerariifolium]